MEARLVNWFMKQLVKKLGIAAIGAQVISQFKRHKLEIERISIPSSNLNKLTHHLICDKIGHFSCIKFSRLS